MKHKITWFLIPGLIALLGANSVWADHFKRLSTKHTSYGVSQLNYANLSQDTGVPSPVFKLMNPGHVTQAAAAFVYSSARGDVGTDPEVYLGCSVAVVPPHGSIGITGDDLVTVPGGEPLYGEVIWAPLEKVDFGKHKGKEKDYGRIADGLGGSFGGARSEGESRLAHPGLFSLPSDSAFPGQRQAAIDCVCADLGTLGESPDIFSEFGIDCP
jgi:hypothetical protein